MVVDYSPKTVGAYRIRPDVSENEFTLEMLFLMN